MRLTSGIIFKNFSYNSFILYMYAFTISLLMYTNFFVTITTADDYHSHNAFSVKLYMTTLTTISLLATASPLLRHGIGMHILAHSCMGRTQP